MNNIIKLLPDHVANQIAAGEVVQRPASAVKELLENAVDAGAKAIQLIVKEGGKTLIQVTDDGKGMNEVDIRMAFERHATSKISSAEEIFSIQTKGFRGEALASIAAVSHVECSSRTEDSEMGNLLYIEGSRIVEQGFKAMPVGTSILVKNLFYNIPARRNFLKSEQVEYRHVLEEFERVAIAHPDIRFKLFHNDHEIYNLIGGNLRQRLVALYAGKTNENLVPVSETTEWVKVEGFVGKPSTARKTRGEQFFFVNRRFIKSSYLHHAVSSAFQDLIQEGTHPTYFLFIDVPPNSIDINIHPTKTEIKFEDERMVYSIIRVAVKHALGQHNVMPSIDFDNEIAFQAPLDKNRPIVQPTITVNPNYNPFEMDAEKEKARSQGGGSSFSSASKIAGVPQGWEQLYAITQEVELKPTEASLPFEENEKQEIDGTSQLFQIDRKYILYMQPSGVYVIHQQRAHQRVLYEYFLSQSLQEHKLSQQLLFPQNITFNPRNYEAVKALLPSLQNLGFDMEEFGNNSFAVYGMPVGIENQDIEKMLLQIVEEVDIQGGQGNEQLNHELCKALALSSSIKTGQSLSTEEMEQLVAKLLACQTPYMGLAQKACMIQIKKNDLDKQFN